MTPGSAEPYKTLEAGTELWHVYGRDFAPTALNPVSTNRFSARYADPPRSMFYTGSNADCAIWETVLRDVVPSAAPPHDVTVEPQTNRSIVRIRLKRDLKVLDLGRPDVRFVAGADSEFRNEVISATVEKNYASSHRIAARLLDEYPDTAGIHWPSKQIDSAEAYVFYKGPVGPDDFEVLQEVLLDSPAGLVLIDRALAKAGMHRAGAIDLSTELMTQLPLNLDDP